MQGMTHCAAEGIVRIMPAVTAWLRLHLYGQTIPSRLLLGLAKQFLPRRMEIDLTGRQEQQQG
jgi:esterase FrsA